MYCRINIVLLTLKRLKGTLVMKLGYWMVDGREAYYDV